MDALTHAIEAYVSTLHCPYTDLLALQAIEMVLEYLPASYNCNIVAREQMNYAQFRSPQYVEFQKQLQELVADRKVK